MGLEANWKGYLKLSLVSCAVNLYPALAPQSRVSFSTINRDGQLGQASVIDAEAGEVVEPMTNEGLSDFQERVPS